MHKKKILVIFKKKKKDLNKKDLDRKNDAKEIQIKMSEKVFNVSKLSTENKELYGSIKPTEISKIIKEYENVDIKSSLIQPTKDIKSLGKFKVNINLHSEIQISIYINVISEDKK